MGNRERLRRLSAPRDVREGHLREVNRLLKKPVAGVMIPLFSIRAARRLESSNKTAHTAGWGIGEILDLIPFIDFMSETGLSVLQLLPLNEMAEGETSPYNSLSAFAFDPIYLSLEEVEDFRKSPEAQAACQEILSDRKRWNKSTTVCYEAIRPVKNRILRILFERFKREEWPVLSPRIHAFKSFMENEADWLDDYALFRCLQERWGQKWTDWPALFRKRYPKALLQFEEENKEALLFIKYLQWVCQEQWTKIRDYARDKDILIMGDIPFLLSVNSADVWSHQKLFCRTKEREGSVVGAPPDQFNPQGQKWGFPLFCWEAMEQSKFAWWKRRIQKGTPSFDILRLDHIVGFFRVWVFPDEGAPHFEPVDEVSQIERGRLFLRVLDKEAGSCLLIGEDLGVVPSFVQAEMNVLGMPGIKILRWQKKEGRVIPPKEYPALSLATTGTHDMSSLAVWWDGISHEEQSDFMNALNGLGKDPIPAAPFSREIHQHILRGLLEAGSRMVIVPFQDIFGGSEQINFPGTCSDQNWRYRMPDNIESLPDHPDYKEKIGFLKSTLKQTGR